MMDCTVEKKGAISVIRLLHKRATAEIAREFKDFLFETVEDLKGNTIVIDLQEVGFMDSFFLGAIVSGLKKSQALNGTILLAAVQDTLMPVFQLMHLDEVFKIYPSVDAAVASI